MPDAVVPADIDESVPTGELPRDHALRLAREKAEAVAAREPDALVLAADTVVAVGRRILPKVEDEATLRACMKLLSGRRHRVLTGVALAVPGGAIRERLVETMIAMKRLSRRRNRLLRRPWRMARQGRRLRAPGLWRSLCPPHRRQLFQRRRPAAGRDAAAAEVARDIRLPEWLIERGHRRDPRRADRRRRDRRGADPAATASSPAGTVLDARLVARRHAARSSKPTARSICCRAVLRASPKVRRSRIEVTREAIPAAPSRGSDRSRGVTDEAPRAGAAARREGSLPSPTTAARRAGPTCSTRRAAASFAFAGGELRISLTPAMTLIDVDGWLAAAELRDGRRGAAARAIRRLGIGGSIGIDLPTVAGQGAATGGRRGRRRRSCRKPFERTAVNGFGFLQIVRPRRARVAVRARRRTARAFEARALLRRAAPRRTARCGSSPIPRSSPCSSAARLARARSRARSAARVTLRADACAPHVGRLCRTA